jgi:uncharacterized protein YfkK (UPF0435 family)
MLYPFIKIAYRRWTQEEVDLLKEEILQGRSLGESFKDIYQTVARKLKRSPTEVERKLIRLYRTDEQLRALKQEDWSRAKILDQIKGLYLNNQPINKNHLPDKLKYILLKVVPPAAPQHRSWFESVDHALAEAVFSCKYPRLEDGSLDRESPLNSLEEALKYIRLGHKKRHTWSLEEIKQILTELNDADYPITLPFLANHYNLYKDLININRKLESLRDVIKKFIDDGQIQSYADLVCGIAPDYVDYYSPDRSRLRLSTEEIRVKKFLDRFQIPYVIPRLSDKIQTGLPNFNNFVPDFILIDDKGVPLAIVEVFGSIGDRENAGVNDIYNNKTKAKVEFYNNIPNLKFIEIYNNSNKCDLDDGSLFDRFGSYIKMQKQAKILLPFTKKAQEKEQPFVTIYTKEHGRQELTGEEWDKFELSSITFHREDGPAVELPDGTKYWYINGKLHSIEYADGEKQWFKNGKRHREDGPAIEYNDGTKEWYMNGELHREDGYAVEDANGTKYWYINGKQHREDGAAVEHTNGTKHWYLNGQRHRIDGPAVDRVDGTKEWFVNGKRHRIDGPAVELPDGTKEWWMNGMLLQDPEKSGKPLLEQFSEQYSKKQTYNSLVGSQDISPFKYTGPAKLWLQMAENAPTLEDQNINGEVCVTPFGTGQKVFRESDGHLGYIWKGKPSYYFPFDVYSVVNKNGKRSIDFDDIQFNTNQEEAWLTPAKSQLVGLLYVTNQPNLKSFVEKDKEGVEFLLSQPSKKSYLRFPSGKVQEVTGKDLQSQEDVEHEHLENKVASLEDLVTTSFFASQSNLQKYGCSILYNTNASSKPYSFLVLGEQDLRFDSLLELPKLTPKNKAMKSIIDRIMEKQKYRFTSPLNSVEQQKDYQPRNEPIDNESERGLPISYQEPRFR